MTFREVGVLWLLALVPVAFLYLAARERMRTRLASRLISERLRGGSTARTLRPWLLAGGLCAALVALAGPYSGFTVVPVTARETNRILVIDVSNSMAATDVGTSRLEAATALAARLAVAQQGRIGLIVFEGSANVLAPLTTDVDAVAALLASVRAGEVGEPGSDIGGAVMKALSLVEGDPSIRADVVVLTDGEDQGTRAEEAAKRARTLGVPVSVIVLGSAAGSNIPSDDGPLRDDSGQVVTTYARAEVPAQLAAVTGGAVHRNPFAAGALDPLLRGGVSATARKDVRVPVDRFQWPLALALIAFLGGSMLNRGAD